MSSKYISESQAVALAMPLVSYPFMELLKETINYASIQDSNKKKLIELVEKTFKVAPGTSCLTINKDGKTLELYIELDNTDFDCNKNMKDSIKYMNLSSTEIKQFLESAGQLLLYVNVYFDSIKQRAPDVFNKLKKELDIPGEDKNDVFEAVFIDEQTRTMYIDYRLKRRLMFKSRQVDELRPLPLNPTPL
jgi:hypothetical protein